MHSADLSRPIRVKPQLVISAPWTTAGKVGRVGIVYVSMCFFYCDEHPRTGDSSSQHIFVSQSIFFSHPRTVLTSKKATQKYKVKTQRLVEKYHLGLKHPKPCDLEKSRKVMCRALMLGYRNHSSTVFRPGFSITGARVVAR